MFSFRTTALEDQLDRALLDGRVGCFCTQNCWDTARGRYMYDLFTERGNLKALFSPRDAELTPGTNHIMFDKEALEGLDAVVVEIQDAGSRYFNYSKDVFHLMETLAGMENPPSLYIVDHINPAGRVDVVNNVQRRWILHPGERLHQVEHVLAVVEVPRPRVLDLHHHGIQPLKRFLVEHDVVRSRCQLRVPGTEQSLEVSPFREQVVHVSPPRRVPAVLCAEAPDPPVQQCPIQLILQRRSPE